ncbi:21310_t:CDS:2, partial [Dentiscutata erythropus]
GHLYKRKVADNKYKANLLTHLAAILSIKLEPCSVKPPSSFLYFKTALKLKHINIAKFKDYYYKFDNKTSSKISKALGRKIWQSHSKIKKGLKS